MSLQCRQITLLIICLILSMWSIGYFFTMMLLPHCQLTPINTIFIMTIALMWAMSAIYFSKLLICGASCCTWLYGLVVILGLLELIVLIILGHDIVSAYGIGFHGLCQTFTSIYLFGNGALFLLICGLVLFVKFITSPSYDELA
jgi:hypothetical protein